MLRRLSIRRCSRCRQTDRLGFLDVRLQDLEDGSLFALAFGTQRFHLFMELRELIGYGGLKYQHGSTAVFR